MTDLLDRLADKFVVADNGCWNWTAYTSGKGYGQVRVAGRVEKAHRAVYEAVVEPIPTGMQIDHLCRNRSCVNPDHLEPVTAKVNQERGMWAQKTHCPHGHEYTPENTVAHPRSGRMCRECRRQRAELRNRRNGHRPRTRKEVTNG